MTGSPTKPATEATRQFAELATAVKYEDLPPGVTTALKRVVLDTLGTTLAAGTLGAGCREVVEVARLMGGGTPESTLIGFGDRISALMASFANGGMAHALNYDAIGAGHLGALVPAPLAIAERRGGVSGKEFLLALALGAEVTARINTALSAAGVTANEKFLEGQMVSTFGAAASAGRLLGLSTQQMHSALGLALMQCSGSMQVVVGGDPPSKAIYAAFPNHGGVLSALLSKQGLGSECDALEGEAGFFAMYYGGVYDREALLAGLGEQFAMEDVRFKPWPTSGVLHSFIEASLGLRNEHALKAKDIARVHIRTGPQVSEWMEPLAARRAPQNAAAAANSIPFGVAKALANGSVALADFTADGLRQPDVLAMAERLSYEFEEGLGRSATIEVTTTGGQRHTNRVDQPLGSAANPMTPEQLVAKFRDCAQHAPQALSHNAVDEIISLVDRLDEMEDVSSLLRLVSGSR